MVDYPLIHLQWCVNFCKLAGQWEGFLGTFVPSATTACLITFDQQLALQSTASIGFNLTDVSTQNPLEMAIEFSISSRLTKRNRRVTTSKQKEIPNLIDVDTSDLARRRGGLKICVFYAFDCVGSCNDI